jgi:penicillin-binding protein-related factor A (putative recombinase)
MKLSRKEQGYANKKSGDFGEEIAKITLREFGYRIGIRMIEKVHTPYKLIYKNGKVTHAFPLEKVSGDFIGIGSNGQKILIEVKKTQDHLSWADFKEHQREALEINNCYGGLSLVIWVYKHTCTVYDWKYMKLIKGQPIKFESPEYEIGKLFVRNF